MRRLTHPTRRSVNPQTVPVAASLRIHEVLVRRLRRHAEAGDRKSFDMTAEYNGIGEREANQIWNEVQR